MRRRQMPITFILLRPWPKKHAIHSVAQIISLMRHLWLGEFFAEFLLLIFVKIKFPLVHGAAAVNRWTPTRRMVKWTTTYAMWIVSEMQSKCVERLDMPICF